MLWTPKCILGLRHCVCCISWISWSWGPVCVCVCVCTRIQGHSIPVHIRLVSLSGLPNMRGPSIL